MASFFRTQAWFGLSLVPLAVYITASQLWPRDGANCSVHEGVMAVAATVGVFTLGMVLAGGLKGALSVKLDWVFALVFASCMAPDLCP